MPHCGVYKLSSEARVALGLNITGTQNAVLLSVGLSDGPNILQHVGRAIIEITISNSEAYFFVTERLPRVRSSLKPCT
jgi:hypothetical protein